MDLERRAHPPGGPDHDQARILAGRNRVAVSSSSTTEVVDGDARPLSVGIWCVVQSPTATATILPNEGIGVFVYNLVVGLLAQEKPPEVVLIALPTEHERVAAYLKAPLPHLRILPPPQALLPVWKDPGRLLRQVS